MYILRSTFLSRPQVSVSVSPSVSPSVSDSVPGTQQRDMLRLFARLTQQSVSLYQDTEAMVQLAHLYVTGRGGVVRQNHVLALSLYHRALWQSTQTAPATSSPSSAAGGAALYLAVMYHFGMGLAAPDPQTATKFYTQAVQQSPSLAWWVVPLRASLSLSSVMDKVLSGGQQQEYIVRQLWEG